MTTELATLIAKRFIARRDVKAQQRPSGAYTPVLERGTNERIPWQMGDIFDHLDGKKTFGHYLVDQDDNCKLFAFDIDLNQTVTDAEGNVTWEGSYPHPEHYGERGDFQGVIHKFNPREAWLDRAHPARAWMKYQFHHVAHLLCATIERELAIPSAVAYSGAKGIHVYGFTGLVPAVDAREGAQIVLDALADKGYGVKLAKGRNFYKFENEHPIDGFPNLSVETFPKQDSIEGKDLGNLMRLPLGVNLKSPDPTFFVDMCAPLNELVPTDPIHALTTASPFRAVGG